MAVAHQSCVPQPTKDLAKPSNLSWLIPALLCLCQARACVPVRKSRQKMVESLKLDGLERGQHEVQHGISTCL